MKITEILVLQNVSGFRRLCSTKVCLPTCGTVMKFKLQKLELRASQKTTISPRQQVVVPVLAEKEIGTVTGTVEAFPAFERKTELLVSPSMRDQYSHVQITNHLDHAMTIPQDTTIAVFKILAPNKARNVQSMTKEQLTLISEFPDKADKLINQLFQDPEAFTDKRWYPTPETRDNADKLNKIERRIYDKIVQLRNAGKLDPTCDDEQ